MLNRGNKPAATLRLPLPVNDVTQASSIISVVAEAHSTVAGAAGTTGSFMLNFGPVGGLLGDLVGSPLDTSLSFSGTVLTTEVSYQQVLARNTVGNVQIDDPTYNLTSLLNNGEYYVVYETGRIYYKKADASTTANATYKYRSGSTSSSGGGGSSSQTAAAKTTTGGTVAATNTVGGTTIVAANANRAYTLIQNLGSVNVFFGATPTTAFPVIVPNGAARWDSQEALKVLSSGIDCNIAFIDYSNV